MSLIFENSKHKIIQTSLSDQWKYNLSEIQIMSDLNRDFVVKYFGSWIEEELRYNFDVDVFQSSKILYIKMELCSEILRKILTPLNKIQKRFKIYISCHLLKELIKAVNYLHSIKPNPIIHRDLKPENVITTDGINRIFLKLCDFNLAKALGIEDEKQYLDRKSVV